MVQAPGVYPDNAKTQISSSSSSVMERPSVEGSPKLASSTALAWHSDGGGIPKPMKSLLQRGFLNSLPLGCYGFKQGSFRYGPFSIRSYD
jgi:hypothetical protein